jgi:hypothetical protein
MRFDPGTPGRIEKFRRGIGTAQSGVKPLNAGRLSCE